MDSPMKQAAKLMKAKKSGSRKLALFLCLALLVTAGTTLVFKLNAQAKEHRVRVLDCAYEVHQHTEDCYPGGDTNADPVCGLADFVVHVHNDADCYNEAGELVCTLEEIEEHEHDESCYTQQLVCEIPESEAHEHLIDCYAAAEGAQPICELEEQEAAEGHTHGDECYTGGESTLICGQEEGEGAVPGHAHDDSCYTETDSVTELTCGQEESEEHTHDDSCYTTTPGERVLTCGQEESEGHAHNEGCYTTTPGGPVLTCGQEEGEGAVPGHVHDESCYETSERELICEQEEVDAVEGHAHTVECYAEEDRELICEQEESEGHAHDDACYGEPELICEKPEVELHIHSGEEGCYAELTEEEKEAGLEHGALTCEKLQVEEHNHTEECFVTEVLTAEDLEMEAKPVIEDLQLSYADEQILITVDYDTTAKLPGDVSIALISADTPAPELDPSQEAVLVAPAEGEAPAEDAEAAPAEGEDAAPVEGEDAVPAEGEDAAPVEGEDAAPAEAGEAAPAEIEDETNAAPEAENAEAAGEDDNTENTENAENTENTEAAPETGEAAPAEAGEATLITSETLVRAGFVDGNGREWRPAATVTYTVRYLMDGQAVGEPVQYHYTPGGELPSFPRGIARYTQTVETDEYIVTAAYTALAQLGDARLYALPITEEELVADYTAQYREAVNSSRAQMHVLMDIGFMLDGEEIQPAAPVEITVQLLGEDGLPAGKPLTVVHFGAEGNDVIAAEADESGTAAFRLNGFSPVGIGQTPESDDEGQALLNEQNGTFEWTDPNGLYHVTFQVSGVITPKAEDDEEPEDAGQDAAAPEEGEDAGAPEGEETEEPADEGEEEDAPEADTSEIPVASANLLSFNVEVLSEEDEAYLAYADAAQASGNELLGLSVMRYSLTYGDIEMDLSDCEVIATIAPTMQMQALSEAYAEENPVDNGDDDGDGYVLAADGESLLPAPVVSSGMRFSVMAPGAPVVEEDAAPAEAAALDSDAPVTVHASVELEGAGAGEGQQLLTTAAMPAAMLAAVPAAEIDMMGAPAAVTLSDKVITVNLSASQQSDILPHLIATLALEEEGDSNPTFRVQYYANIQVMKPSTSGGVNDGIVELIDTSAAKNGGNPKLPENGAANASKIKILYLKVKDGVFETEWKLTEVYKEKTFELQRAPELIYTEALIKNDHYYLYPEEYGDAAGNTGRGELWVLKPGGDDDSIDEDDWHVYQIYGRKVNSEEIDGVLYTRVTYLTSGNAELTFTNNNKNGGAPFAETAPDGHTIYYIPVNENTVIRWVYNIHTKNRDISANFYDYNITTGLIYRAKPNYPLSYTNYKTAGQTFSGDSLTNDVLTWAAKLTEGNGWDGHLYAYTRESGINSPENYTGSGARLAFGNVNTGTGLGLETWNGNHLNMHDSVGKAGDKLYGNGTYQGCTFGLVTGLTTNSSGNRVLQYASGVQAPNLFNDGSATGKVPYDNGQYSLQFRQVGDTYTLIAVNGTGATNLDHFNNPVNSQGNYDGQHGKTAIWTNNFWPMDSALSYGTGTNDVKFGAKEYFKKKTHELRFGPITEKTGDYTFPESDDGLNHNSYFGMQYEIEFYLHEDYVGPLEYYFFGDDDMWVFLDGKLVCDIGGVHSTVGEYVNLWDYIPGGRLEHGGKDYTLSVFYTERGASGSTCWTQFTLPAVTSLEPGKTPEEYGTLRIDKTVTRVTHDGNKPNKIEENYNSDELFTFIVDFSFDDTVIPDWYEASLYEGDTCVNNNLPVYSGGPFTLKANEHIIIRGLLAGTTYTIKEVSAKDAAGNASNTIYETDVVGSVGAIDKPVTNAVEWNEKVVTGTIKKQSGNAPGNMYPEVYYTNRYHVYVLPKTGGVPAIVYTGAGAMLVMLAAAAWIQRRRKNAADTSAR